MPDSPIDPSSLQGDALTRWYQRSPWQIEKGRQAAAEQRYDAFFGGGGGTCGPPLRNAYSARKARLPGGLLSKPPSGGRHDETNTGPCPDCADSCGGLVAAASGIDQRPPGRPSRQPVVGVGDTESRRRAVDALRHRCPSSCLSKRRTDRRGPVLGMAWRVLGHGLRVRRPRRRAPTWSSAGHGRRDRRPAALVTSARPLRSPARAASVGPLGNSGSPPACNWRSVDT